MTTKAQMQSEIRQLKAEIAELRKVIVILERMNKQAFKRQHEAETRLNTLYADRWA